MPRKPRIDEDDSGTWLNTYADMVTLLLTFFAVLLSMSTVDQEKFNAFIQSLQMDPKGVISGQQGEGNTDPLTQTDMDQLYQYLKDYVEENGKSEEVQISKIDEVVYIRFSSNLFFEPDRYTIRENSIPTLNFIGEGLKQYEDKIKMINVCGHTAETHRPNSPINDWMLSGERAATVAMFLQDEKLISGNKIVVMGYGNSFPVGDNTTSEGREQNRRVELVVVGTESNLDFNAYDALQSVYDSQQYPAKGGVDDVLIPSSTTQTPSEEPTIPLQPTETDGIAAPSVAPSAQDEGVESGVSPYED